MSSVSDMLNEVRSAPEYEKVLKFAKPLKDYLGINHFWHYKISNEGFYSYFGSHDAWNEHCFEQALLGKFPCLRHPATQAAGVHFMRFSKDQEYLEMIEKAGEKFNVHFRLNLVKKTAFGMEAFGFATQSGHFGAEENLINEFSLLKSFIEVLKSKYAKLFSLMDEYKIHLPSEIGDKFYSPPKDIPQASKQELFLKELGLNPSMNLTKREMDVIVFLAKGYPASYIASQLELSIRTIENYTSNIKSKLHCKTKVELIQKAQEAISISLDKSF